MNRIRVNTSKKYDIVIGNGLLRKAGKYLSEILPGNAKLAIISDSNVWPIYGETVKKSLLQNGYAVAEFVFPAGEASKNSDTYLQILNFLAENHITRTDAVPAFDGDYTVTPGDAVQVVRCAGMRMSTDIIVTAVPSTYGRVGWNGSTLTVS